jgi:RNA polymerase sigma-70 factor, ECF subfamily
MAVIDSLGPPVPMHPTVRAFPNQQDSDLLNGIARGERRALEQLYLGYHRRLARFLSRIAPRYETVEEIINDTFMVVWQRAADFRGASRVSTWIFGIAYRIALKSLRHSDGLLRVRPGAELPEQAVEPVAETELRDWVETGLTQLPLEQRLTIELAYHMGYSMEEIAAISDCPVGTVKARMYHAREKLRRYLPALAGLGKDDADVKPTP